MAVTKSIFLQKLKIHNDWKPFLSAKIKKQLQEIESQVTGDEFTPSEEKVLRFLEMPLHTVKVIILGQDPYPQPGVATGRAFEVGTLKSWNEPFKNISLKNILRALFKSYSGEILNYNELKTKFDNEFPVLPPTKLFKHWENQGVLLLNTSFTCKPGNPGSHKEIWSEFTADLLNFININFQGVTWFLWGNHAIEATGKLDLKSKIVSQHPMMCYDGPNRETDFLFGKINCFGEMQKEIDWTGFKLSGNFKREQTLF